MQIIPISKKQITSKGKNYTLVHAIDEAGEAQTLFFNDQQVEEYDLNSVKTVPKETLDQMFNDLPTIDVEYGKRGQVVKVTV